MNAQNFVKAQTTRYKNQTPN